jgi:hypothetical protein
VSRFSSSIAPKASDRFPSIRYFSQLIPPTGSMSVEVSDIP